MKTGTAYRRIASLYIDAADILDEIDRLRDDMDPDHWRSRGAHVDAAIAELDKDLDGEDRKQDEQADDAAMWRERCRRYEAHMAEHVPMNYWPEIMGQTDAFVPAYVGPAAEFSHENETPHADKSAWLAALVARLGFDPYVITTRAMRERVEQARSEAELDDLEAGEKSRGEKSRGDRAAKAVRQGVLDAITAQRALLQPVGAKS